MAPPPPRASMRPSSARKAGRAARSERERSDRSLRSSLRVYFYPARANLRPLWDAHRQYSVLETRGDPVGFKLTAQDKSPPVLRGLQVRIKCGHPRRHIELHIAFDEQLVVVGLDIEPVLGHARHFRLHRNLIRVLEDINRRKHWRFLCAWFPLINCDALARR